MKNVVLFSGGQTSGYMLRILMDDNPKTFDKDFIVCFMNTGKEHNATLDFVHDVETRWGVRVVWLEYTRVPAISVPPHLIKEGRKRQNHIAAQEKGEGCHWFKRVSYKTAARRFDKHTPFDELLGWAAALPNVRGRLCSAFLKIRTGQKYLNAIGVTARNDYIGIRYDESDRALEILANPDDTDSKPVFPLVESKTIKREVDEFWAKHPFKINVPNFMGNCDLCFLKSRWKRLSIMRRDPASAAWWIKWEKAFAEKKGGSNNGSQFRSGESYEGMLSLATHPELPLGDEADNDVPCSCAVGGKDVPAED